MSIFRFQYVGETNLPRNIKDILPIAVTNQYIFTEKLGTGACGTVYLAWGKNPDGVWQKVSIIFNNPFLLLLKRIYINTKYVNKTTINKNINYFHGFFLNSGCRQSHLG